MKTEIECVIFDLGGVLIELDGPPAAAANSKLSEDEIWHAWLNSKAVRSYESGKCSREDFALALIEELQLKDTVQSFLTYFEQWPIGFFNESQNTLESLKPNVQLACLSNSNEMHWQRFGAQSPIFGLFDHQFLSFEMGLMKPDPEIYAATQQAIGLDASRLLFIDDNQVNVDSAIAAGWQAERAKGPHEVRTSLIKHGLL